MRVARERAWLIWLGLVAASLAVLETVAYRTGNPPTLSRCSQRWLGVHPRRQRLFWAAVGALSAASPIYTWHVLSLDRVEASPEPVERFVYVSTATGETWTGAST